MNPVSAYNEDYHIFQTTKEEDVMRAIRTGLNGANVPVENSKGEASAGQEEINVRYGEVLDLGGRARDRQERGEGDRLVEGQVGHVHGEVRHPQAGSSSHLHLSLRARTGSRPSSIRASARDVELMRSWVAGLLEHASAGTLFLAPYVNSYKRFAAGTFAPTKAVWSGDNRTAGYRLVGADTPSVRIECRVGGADLNPYLAFAAQIAAGSTGSSAGLELGAEFTGDAYGGERIREIPKTLRDAVEATRSRRRCARRWATRWSSTTCTRRAGSRRRRTGS